MSSKKIPPDTEPTTTPRKPPDAYDKAGRALVQQHIDLSQTSMRELARHLKELGFESPTEESLAQRLRRASYSFGFALRVLRVLGVNTLEIGVIPVYKRVPTKKR